jgi:rhodanese-related sulfurtransferase
MEANESWSPSVHRWLMSGRSQEDDMNPTPVSAEDAKAMHDRGERVVFVDSRNPVAWGSSTVKLPGAIRIPVDGVDEHLGELPRDATAVITYCT